MTCTVTSECREMKSGGPQSQIFRGEGNNIGYSAVSGVQWWSEDRDIASQFGEVKTARVKPGSLVLRLVNPDGTKNEDGYAVLNEIARKYGIEFNVKNALGGACGEELFSDDGGVYVDDARSFVTPGQELLAAVRTENYRVVHTDNIEGPATMVLDQNAIVRD